ncbi:mitotic checkpoint protein-like protein BUB3 [Delphinella strobiligena]|nr:mitotic checkpoint protein-like protein BUB3 [Delphinella strobiligena]
MSGTQFELVDPPTDPISAVRFAPNSPTRLLVASWDKNVYLYHVKDAQNGRLIKTIPHRAAVLDVCFGADDNTAFTGGLDWDVNKIDLETGEKTVVSTHEKGVKSVAYSARHSLLISASWDSTLHIHILDQQHRLTHPPSTIKLASRSFSISLTDTKLVVAMASRQMAIYDLAALKMLTEQSAASYETSGVNELQIEPWQMRESSLKFMTRMVSCMPNDQGYACSSIEGRVGVEWFDPSPESQARKYAFKCHRQTEGDVDVVYPVNALAYHPVHQGSFASGGGDGFVILWDGVTKRRIRQYQAYPASVASLAWSSDGKYLAVGVSPGFEDGKEFTQGPNSVFIRELGENEAKGKSAK